MSSNFPRTEHRTEDYSEVCDPPLLYNPPFQSWFYPTYLEGGGGGGTKRNTEGTPTGRAEQWLKFPDIISWPSLKIAACDWPRKCSLDWQTCPLILDAHGFSSVLTYSRLGWIHRTVRPASAYGSHSDVNNGKYLRECFCWPARIRFRHRYPQAVERGDWVRLTIGWTRRHVNYATNTHWMWCFAASIQGDHSGCSQPPVDMKTKVAF